jgi:hypothetical protein
MYLMYLLSLGVGVCVTVTSENMLRVVMVTSNERGGWGVETQVMYKYTHSVNQVSLDGSGGYVLGIGGDQPAQTCTFCGSERIWRHTRMARSDGKDSCNCYVEGRYVVTKKKYNERR